MTTKLRCDTTKQWGCSVAAALLLHECGSLARMSLHANPLQSHRLSRRIVQSPSHWQAAAIINLVTSRVRTLAAAILCSGQLGCSCVLERPGLMSCLANASSQLWRRPAAYPALLAARYSCCNLHRCWLRARAQLQPLCMQQLVQGVQHDQNLTRRRMSA